jgi:hypothetical protein
MATTALAVRDAGKDTATVFRLVGPGFSAEASFDREGFVFDLVGRRDGVEFSIFVLPRKSKSMVFNYREVGQALLMGGTVHLSESEINKLTGRFGLIMAKTAKTKDFSETFGIMEDIIRDFGLSYSAEGDQVSVNKRVTALEMANVLDKIALTVEQVVPRQPAALRESDALQNAKLGEKNLLEYGKKGRIIANLAGVDTTPGFVRTYDDQHLKIEALRHQVCFSVDGEQVFVVSEVSEKVILATQDQALILECLGLIDSAYAMAGRLQRDEKQF